MPKAHTLRAVRRILAATGLTTESVGAVLVAKRLSGLLDAELDVVHVLEPLSRDAQSTMPDLAARQEALAREELETFAQSHGLMEGRPPGLHVRRGEPRDEILAMRKELRADLLVIGRYGKGGVKRGRLGSIAASVVRQCTVSTLVVQPEFRGEFRSIALATDLDAESDIPLRRALEIAQVYGAEEVALLSAYELPVGYHTVMTEEDARSRLRSAGHERAQRLVEHVCGSDGPKVRIELCEGPAATAIPRLASELGVELLVIGSHYRTSRTASAVLGRTTEKILSHVDCSVWAETTPDLEQGLKQAFRHLFD